MQGQTAIVTGGSRGLGFAVAKRLLDNGAQVSIWDIDQVGLDEACSALAPLGPVHSVKVNVTSEPDVDHARDETLSRFGSISILVNNAGISGKHTPVWQVELADWQRTINVNLTGVFLCCKAVIPTMLASDYGRIVNIASIAGKEASPFISGYSASKAGVVGLTKTLGRELAKTKITANCVTPAAIKTAIFDQWPSDYVAELLGKIPMGRFGTPEELASLVAWIASTEASFTTGAIFDLSGGRADY